MVAGTAAIRQGMWNKAAVPVLGPLLRAGAAAMALGAGLWLALRPLLRNGQEKKR